MISSTSSADRSIRPETEVAASLSRPPLKRPALIPDAISTEGAQFLRAMLESQPEVRPEVVARGRQLAADPNYPPREVVQNVAGQILGAPDLSEIE